MANSTTNRTRYPYGKGGRDIVLPVAASTKIWEGVLVTQLTATGGVAPFTTAGGGACCGMATHEQDNTAGIIGAVREVIETDRIFVVDNASDVLDTTPIGTALYGTDDHTVSISSSTGTRPFAGTFAGLEPDNRVRLFVSISNVTLAAALVS